MKKVFFLIPFLFLATSASAQVITAEPETVVAPEAAIEITAAETTEVAPEVVATTSIEVSTSSTTTTQASSTPDEPVVVETIEIIPGSVSLKLTAPKPAPRTSSESLTPTTLTTEDTDGLFNLIYTGFEEFVFRVFGI